MKDIYGDFLYARPSFLEGMARVMDIGGTLNEYNTFLSDEDADFFALSMDWHAVGQDMRDAMAMYESEEADALGLGD